MAPAGSGRARAQKKAIILCDGMPTVPSKRALMAFFAKKGYWVFHPRYRGTWESGGQFLRRSPEKDILDVIGQLPRGFPDVMTRKTYKLKPAQLILLGGSFGGPAIILASRDPRVTKGIAFCPVVDWKKITRINTELRNVEEGFGAAYRFSMKDWNKLTTRGFYNPVDKLNSIAGSKLFIIQAKDDESVGWKPVSAFAKNTGTRIWLMKKGGHLSTSLAMKPQFYKRINKFLKAN